MSVFKGRRYDALFPGQRRRSRAYEGRAGREVGRLDDGRSSSDARVGYRIPEIRPGLLPLLLRASVQERPAQASDGGSPAVAPPPALHGRRWRKDSLRSLGGVVPPVPRIGWMA